MSVTVFGAAYSVYVRIARLALEEKGVAYLLREVDIFAGGDTAEAHRRRQPFGKIPAFDHDGFGLYEAAAIARYVDEAFDGPALQPADVEQRARMGQIVGLMDSYGYRSLVWDVYVQLSGDPAAEGRTDEAVVARGLAQATIVLGELERLRAGKTFLASDTLSLADLHAAPMLSYFMATEQGREMVDAHPGLAAWVEMMRERPAVTATKPAEAPW